MPLIESERDNFSLYTNDKCQQIQRMKVTDLAAEPGRQIL